MSAWNIDPVAALASLMVVLPLAAFGAVALLEIVGRTPTDRTLARVARVTFGTTSLAWAAAATLHILRGAIPIRLLYGHWFGLSGDHGEHYGFDLGVLIDGTSLVYLGLTAILCGTVGAFSLRYMTNEPRSGRFFQLLMLFASSLSLLALAESLDLLFVGWELVGITSALLIAFYRERIEPVRHGLVAFAIYRVCDAALLAALVVLHQTTGGTSLTASPAVTGSVGATVFGLLVLFASLGKSAQWPFSSWLPRAMEGPTPSSAIFYGALSIHAGAYLLLRTSPLWSHSITVRVAVFITGLLSAVFGTIVGRAQTDAKSSLAYAAIVQVGLIYLEIALGFERLALVHIAGHATLRTLEFLRAPSLVAEHQLLEAELGRAAPTTGVHYERLLPRAVRERLYVFAMGRGHGDALAAWLLLGVRRMLLVLDRMDRAMAGFLDPVAIDPLPVAPTSQPSLARRSQPGRPRPSSPPEDVQ